MRAAGVSAPSAPPAHPAMSLIVAVDVRKQILEVNHPPREVLSINRDGAERVHLDARQAERIHLSAERRRQLQREARAKRVTNSGATLVSIGSRNTAAIALRKSVGEVLLRRQVRVESE